MTEVEWLSSTDPQAMLTFLWGHFCVSDRKLRLFAVACCRRVEHLMADERSRRALEVAERFAEEEAANRLREQWFSEVDDTPEGLQLRQAFQQIRSALFDLPDSVARRALEAVAHAAWCWGLGPRSPAHLAAERAGADAADVADVSVPAVRGERATQATLLRCIFGVLPFRDVSVAPSWRTPTVVGLAQRVYVEKAFELMPVLGDALEEAGCTDADILHHLRGPGPHARGCWVVDLLLDKGGG